MNPNKKYTSLCHPVRKRRISLKVARIKEKNISIPGINIFWFPQNDMKVDNAR